jgi:hypothetical protein
MQTAPERRLLRLEQADTRTGRQQTHPHPLLQRAAGGEAGQRDGGQRLVGPGSRQAFSQMGRDQPKMAVQNAGSLE